MYVRIALPIKRHQSIILKEQNQGTNQDSLASVKRKLYAFQGDMKRVTMLLLMSATICGNNSVHVNKTVIAPAQIKILVHMNRTGANQDSRAHEQNHDSSGANQDSRTCE